MRILRILTRPNVGGPTREVFALWHADADVGTQTLLVVGEVPDYEVSGLDASAPLLAAESITPDSRGVVQLPSLRRGIAPLRDRRAQRAIGELIDRFQPDVVHTHTSKAGVVGRRAALRMGVPVIAHTFHGHVLQDYFSPVASAALRRLEIKLAKRTHVLTAVSQSCAAELTALGVTNGDILVVPPAVDLTPFLCAPDNARRARREAARELLGLSQDAPVVAFVGRLTAVKRPLVFVEVLEALGKSMPSKQPIGIVFGDGRLRIPLVKHALARGVFDSLREIGTVDLPPRLPAADVVVFCSRREGLPIAGLEALAAGIPVVGWGVPGVTDLLERWFPAGLVERNAGVAGLAAAVQRSLEDLQAPQQLQAAASGLVAEHAPRVIARALAEQYRLCRAAH